VPEVYVPVLGRNPQQKAARRGDRASGTVPNRESCNARNGAITELRGGGNDENDEQMNDERSTKDLKIEHQKKKADTSEDMPALPENLSVRT
jgi:hypothetical protein